MTLFPLIIILALIGLVVFGFVKVFRASNGRGGDDGSQGSIPKWKYYIVAVLLGTLINLILLVVILNLLGFEGKSLIALIYISVTGYFKKSIFFFLPLLLLSVSISTVQKRLILLAPFVLMVLWFLAIIVFKIESLSYEISYGYTARAPHFYFQLIATLLVCLIIRSRTNIRIKNLDTSNSEA